ncbi:DUF885 domain-containing protein [Terriglobus tenax]|uniref:DUF885 domain-containing protein n=1 Tax=Terriglobus tenax TaxID=1111115 RepID=UPI0021DFE72D|nr:DUF885 domain-containing protein [Terriglobus tenax]
MRTLPALLLTGTLVTATLSPAVFAQTSVADRIAQQNKLFEDQFQDGLRRSPQRATAYGDYRYNDKLDDDSLAAIADAHQNQLKYLAALDAISTAGFPEQDKLSHDLMVRSLKTALANYDLKNYEMPVDQMGGPHSDLADLPNAVPLDSVKHYEDYIARLHQIPRVFEQNIEIMKAGERDHLMPVKFLLEKVPAQCDGVIAANPFLNPIKKFPASFSEEDKKRLTAQITDTVNQEVFPAYRSFAAFVKNEYAPHGRTTLAITSLSEGKKRYQAAIYSRTTTNLPPAQIHQIGLDEIKRIEAEMTQVAKRAGFSDLASFRASLKDNPKYIPKSEEEILDNFRRAIAQMEPKLPQLFGLLPKSPVTVEAIPPYQAAMATHYQTGTPDGKRPGRVSVAVSDFQHRDTIKDEAVAYHEGIPGHHMQLSIQQQLTGLPKFRMRGGNSAYVEGWALYAEELGKEVGFYQDPVSDYGRLSSELFRAVRLVVDTGIHDLGWSREQVVEFMRNSHAVDEPTIQSETDRYIAWPAQALSYKLGQLKIVELRARAQKELGPKFDIRTFHDEILSGGALPLDVLDARVTGWIAEQKAAK